MKREDRMRRFELREEIGMRKYPKKSNTLVSRLIGEQHE